MEKKGTISSLIMPVFAVLLCLTLLSTWLMSNMYARYTTQATGEDSARVAKFDVTETGSLTQDIHDVAIAPGQSAKYEVKVTNKSEVAVRYSITAVSKYKNLPLEFQMYRKTTGRDTDSDVVGSANSSSSMQAVSEDSIQANDNTERTYILKISWPKKNEESDVNYMGKTDAFVITLKAEQID